MKNKLITSIFITVLVITISACKKSFFDSPTYDGSVNEATAYKTKADFDAGVIGAYVNLQSAFEPSIRLPGFISNDITNAEGNAVTFDRIFDNSYFITKEMWTEYYKIINNTNIVIQKLNTIEPDILTEEEISRNMGQVKFLRGFAYMNLTQSFGDIPMPLEGYTTTQNSMTCTNEAEVWAQIISDLEDASNKLPETNEWENADVGRVGKGAALGYLALAYMYKKDWAKAGEASEKLFALTKPKYELKEKVREEFSALHINQNSSVFEIQFDPNSADKWIGWGGNGPNNGHTMPDQTAPPGIGYDWSPWGGWGNYIISPKALSIYEPGDDRRKELIIKYPESYKGESMADTFRAENWPADFPDNRKEYGYSTKYWFGTKNSPTGENIVMMRFAEVVLNYAEIQFMRGNISDAYTQLNKIVTRAGLLPKPESTDPEVFMNDLMNERRREFMLEPGVWWHFTRTGRAAKFLKDNYDITMVPKWLHLPIPSIERDVNPNLCTNGY